MSCDPKTCRYVHAQNEHIAKEICPDSFYCDAFGLDDDDVAAHMISHHGGASAEKPAEKPAEKAKTFPRKTETPKKQTKERKPPVKTQKATGPKQPVPVDAEKIPYLNALTGCKWVVEQYLRVVNGDGSVRYLVGVCGRNRIKDSVFCAECHKINLEKKAKRDSGRKSGHGCSEEDDAEKTEIPE